MKLKQIHEFMVGLVKILQQKVEGEEKSGLATKHPETHEYTKGQFYEACYILERIESIIYEK